MPVVRVSGEIDHATVGRFKEAITRAASGGSPRRVVADLSDVDFMDSEGLRVIFDALRRLGERGIELRLVIRQGGRAQRLFEVAEVRDRLPLFRDVGSAVEDR